MSDQDELKSQTDILFNCLKGIYGDQIRPEIENDLKSAMQTVIKTMVALRSVPLESHGDLSLPFTPYKKEG
jgi:hypothetical protein